MLISSGRNTLYVPLPSQYCNIWQFLIFQLVPAGSSCNVYSACMPPACVHAWSKNMPPVWVHACSKNMPPAWVHAWSKNMPPGYMPAVRTRTPQHPAICSSGNDQQVWCHITKSLLRTWDEIVWAPWVQSLWCRTATNTRHLKRRALIV